MKPPTVKIIHRPAKFKDKAARISIHQIADALKEYSDLIHELADRENLDPEAVIGHLKRILADVQDQLGFVQREGFRE